MPFHEDNEHDDTPWDVWAPSFSQATHQPADPANRLQVNQNQHKATKKTSNIPSGKHTKSY